MPQLHHLDFEQKEICGGGVFYLQWLCESVFMYIHYIWIYKYIV